MINLFDIARNAQGGAGFDALARQFGLDGEQTRRIVEGLLPAFSLALRRSALDPTAFANVLGMVASGRYAPFFDGSGAFRPGGGAPDGGDLLRRLFGSEDASREVAAQVSALTGAGLSAVQHVMPALAGMLAGGLYRHATIDGYADALRRWADALQAGAPRPAPRSNVTDPWAAWSDMVASMGRPKPPPPPEPHPLQPWTDMVGALLGAPAKPEPPPPPPPSNPLEAFSQMFETGREAQAQHLASLQGIIDAAWGAKR